MSLKLDILLLLERYESKKLPLFELKERLYGLNPHDISTPAYGSYHAMVESAIMDHEMGDNNIFSAKSDKNISTFPQIVVESGNHRFELHYSDGIRGMLKGNSKESLIADILKKPGVKEWSLFKNDSKFHSTGDEEFLVLWWGDGSFWDNRSKSEPELKEKKYKYKSKISEAKSTINKGAKMAKAKNSLVVCLAGVGNPDFGQYANVSRTEYVPVKSIKHASEVCSQYINDNDLGGGNWGGDAGEVYDVNGKVVAVISYNGRMWKKIGGAEISKEEAEKEYYVSESARNLADKVRGDSTGIATNGDVTEAGINKGGRTTKEYTILMWLNNGDRDQISLRKILAANGIPTATLAKNMERLEDEGYVKLTDKEYSITDAGKKYYQTLKNPTDEAKKRIDYDAEVVKIKKNMEQNGYTLQSIIDAWGEKERKEIAKEVHTGSDTDDLEEYFEKADNRTLYKYFGGILDIDEARKYGPDEALAKMKEKHGWDDFTAKKMQDDFEGSEHWTGIVDEKEYTEEWEEYLKELNEAYSDTGEGYLTTDVYTDENDKLVYGPGENCHLLFKKGTKIKPSKTHPGSFEIEGEATILSGLDKSAYKLKEENKLNEAKEETNANPYSKWDIKTLKMSLADNKSRLADYGDEEKEMKQYTSTEKRIKKIEAELESRTKLNEAKEYTEEWEGYLKAEGIGESKGIDHEAIAKIIDSGNFEKSALAKKAGIDEKDISDEDVQKIELYSLKLKGKTRKDITNPRYSKTIIDSVFEAKKNWVKSEFTIDDADDGYFPGYHDPTCHWNGWATPVFEKDIALKICKKFECPYEEKDGKLFVKLDAEDDADMEDVGPMTIKVDDKEVVVYDIGAYNWVWAEKGDD